MKRIIALATVLSALAAPALADETFVFRHKSGLIAAEAVDEGEGGEDGEQEPQSWIVISDAPLPEALVGHPWSFDFAPLMNHHGVDAGTVQWSFGEGGGPEGLHILSSGTVVGYPVMPGSHAFEVVASQGETEGRRAFTVGVGLPGGWIDVASSWGATSVCGLKEGGMAWCWGSNARGELGVGDTSVTHLPVPGTQVVDNARFTEIDGGSRYFCGLDTAGSVWCWGAGEYGQLGQSDTEDRSEPVMVQGGHAFQSMTVGYSHSCGLKGNGEVWCWGKDYGPEPSLVVGHHFVQVTGGLDYTCGVKADDTGWCWGSTNGYFQLGTPDGSSMTPREVSGGHAFSSIRAGRYTTCGVRTDATGVCWGDGGNAVRGDDTLAGSTAAPAVIHGGHSFASMSAPGMHACGVTVGGHGLCWGQAQGGRIGDGSAGLPRRTPASVLGGHLFQKISVTVVSATCGLRVDGAILCWGSNIGRDLENPEISDDPFLPERIFDPA